jgi:hypothetical protein
MIEQISKMNAEELPAVVTGIQNEIGTSEAEQFQQSAGGALTQLQQSLTEAKTNLSSSLGVITGEGAAMPGEELGGEELGGEPESDLGSDLGDEEFDQEDMEMDTLPEPEEEDLDGAGREMR